MTTQNINFAEMVAALVKPGADIIAELTPNKPTYFTWAWVYLAKRVSC